MLLRLAATCLSQNGAIGALRATSPSGAGRSKHRPRNDNGRGRTSFGRTRTSIPRRLQVDCPQPFQFSTKDSKLPLQDADTSVARPYTRQTADPYPQLPHSQIWYSGARQPKLVKGNAEGRVADPAEWRIGVKKYLITGSVLLMSGTSALAAAPAGVSTALDACCAALAACCEALLSCCG